MFYTGLDIGTSSIKFVRLKKAKNAYVVVDYLYQNLPFTSQTAEEGKSDIKTVLIIEELKKLNQKYRFNKDFLITSVSRHAAIIKTVFLPSEDPLEIENMVTFEMEKQIPFPVDKGITDYIIMRNDTFNQTETSQTEVCLLATKGETISRLLALLKAAGLEPNIISVNSLALAVASIKDRQRKKKDDAVYALIDIGNQFTDINLVYKGEVISGRSINLGGMNLSLAIQSKLHVDYTEAETIKRGISEETLEGQIISGLKDIAEEWKKDLSEEIKVSLNLFRKERQNLIVNDILLTGGGSKLYGLQAYLIQNLKMKVEYVNPFIGLDLGAPKEDNYLFSIPVGLALSSDRNVSRVNFIPRDIQDKQEKKKRRRKIIVYAGAAALLLAVVLVSSFNRVARYQLEINKVNEQIKTIEPLIKDTKTMKEQMDELRQALGGSLSSLDMLREVSVHCPSNVYLVGFSYEKGGTAEIKGRTLSHSDVSKFSTALDKSPYFTKVEIKRSESTSYGKINLVDFEISCYPKDYSEK
ncbi:MAG: type IV pilus assembly protein PilM [bacterium]